MRLATGNWFQLLRGQARDRAGGSTYWLLLAAFLLGLNVYAPGSPTLSERLLASGIGLLAFGVIWIWRYRGGEQAEIGFLPVMLIVYFLEYAFVIFTQKLFPMNNAAYFSLLDDAALVKTLLLSLIGLALIVAGYYWPARSIVARVLPRFEMQWRNKNVIELVSLAFIVFSTLAFLVFLRTNTSTSLQSFLSLPGDFFFLSIISLFVLQLQGKLSRGLTVILWGLFIPLRIILGLAQGKFGLGMIVIMTLVITYATFRRRIPWAIYIAGIAVFILLQPVKSTLRQSVFLKGEINKDEAQSDKLFALLDTTERGWAILGTFDLTDVVALATQRLNDTLIFATLVQLTPSVVPYWGGSSYYRILFIPLPRIIYPEKPNYVEGNVFGHQYQMIASDDYMTSINLGQIMEFYGNFGPLGLIIGCFFLGILYRAINDCFVHQKCGLGAIVTGIYLFSLLVDIENSVASIACALPNFIVEVVVFHASVRLAEAVARTKPMNVMKLSRSWQTVDATNP